MPKDVHDKALLKTLQSSHSEYTQVQELRTLRLLSLFAGVLTPVITFIWMQFYPQMHSSYWSGALFSVVFLIIFGLSYISPLVKKQVAVISNVIFFAASLSSLYFAALNNFEEGYTILLLLTIFSVSMAYQSLQNLMFYQLTLLILVIVTVIVKQDQGSHAIVVIFSVAFFFIVSFLTLKTRIDIQKSLFASQMQVQHMAYHDPLTGLPNRTALFDFLEQEIITAKSTQQPISILYLDLDGFKNINDTYGHERGDRLLHLAAERIHQVIRSSDMLSRMGGDEFILVISGLGPKRAEQIAQKILDDFRQPFDISDQKLNTTPSIGISFFPDHGDSAESLITQADGAMYRAKDHGKNRFEIA